MGVPLTILTGFLGSGKSSLLKYILHKQHGIRVAVIMNEFGEEITDMERRVIDSGEEGAFWLNLPNGCLCCAGVDRGLRAIEELLEREKDIEWVLLEASGMADPCSLIAKLWADVGMKSYMDGVICVVDASRPYLYDQENSKSFRQEAVKQAAMADLLIINKIDLTSDITATDSQLSELNPLARRIKTTYCSVPLSHLYKLNAYSSRMDSLEMFSHLSLSHNPHPQSINPLYLHLPSCITVDFNRLENWLFSVLWESSTPPVEGLHGKIFRIKGHVFDGIVHRYIQAVEQVYEAEVLASGDLPGNTFLLIIGTFSMQQTESIKDSFYGTFAAGS